MAPSAAKRSLPKKLNPLLTGDIPEFQELVARRRLGQTLLTAKMVGNSTIIDGTPGAFDYAHLRAPLPKGIVSGIFKSSPNSYFLMRRSQDGYVSATGMFKATFPYAEASEEEAERQYIKSLLSTSPDETAGNVWVPPEQALTLADEYQITPWIRALLDPSKIAISNSTNDNPPKNIKAPPKFDINKHMPNLAPPTPTSLPRSSRSRRSASPSKLPKKAAASPRKRSARVKSESVEPTPSVEQEATPEVSVEEVKEAPVVLQPVEEEPSIKIKVAQNTEAPGEDSKTPKKHTEVDITIPLGATGEPPSAEETRKMLEEAKKMIDAVPSLTEKETPTPEPTKKSKRKAKDMSTGEKEDVEGAVNGEEEDAEGRSAKKVKTEAEERKQIVRRRALYGISATVAVGALVPWLLGAI